MANESNCIEIRLTCALQEIKTLRNTFFKVKAENARLKSLLRANNVLDEAEQSEFQASRDGHSFPVEQEITPIMMKPIGHIESSFANKRAVPRQPTIMNNMRGVVVINKAVFNNPEHALDGLQDYSHMWILFHFHQNEGVGGAKVAPPRLRGERRGVFSTRAPHRPCPIGLSLVQITAVQGNRIEFVGVDMVNGTPVLDVKPYIPQYDMPGPTAHKVYCSSPTVQVPLDLSSSATAVNLDPKNPDVIVTQGLTSITRDLSIPDTPVTQDLPSPNTPITINTTSPNTPETLPLTSPKTSVSQDLTSPNTPITIKTTSPNTPETLPLTSPKTSVSQDLTSPNTPITINTTSQNTPETLPLTSPNTSVTEGPANSFMRIQNLSNSTASTPSGHYLLHGFSGLDESPAVSDQYISPGTTFTSLSAGLTPAFANLTLNSMEPSPETSVYDRMVRDSVRGSPDGQEMLGRVPAPAEVEVRVAPWVNQTPTYTVRFTDHALALLEGFLEDRAPAFRANIERLLAEDPRSQYIRTRYPDSPYNCVLEDLSICCVFDEDSAVCTVTTVRDSMDM